MFYSQAQPVVFSSMGESAKCAALRNKALDGIEALLDAIEKVADGSDEPGDIVDDDLRAKFMDDLDAIMEVRSNIEHPVSNKYTDADFQDAINELSDVREIMEKFNDFPYLDTRRFAAGMMALHEFIHMDDDEDDEYEEDF
jgi:hypothetical protein